MAYYATSPSALEGDPTPENRVWGFFAEPNKARLPNRQQSPQPRRRNRATATRTVSGIPLWPSRDPIQERGGANLYGFVRNDGVGRVDYLGLTVVWPGSFDGGSSTGYDNAGYPLDRPSPSLAGEVVSSGEITLNLDGLDLIDNSTTGAITLGVEVMRTGELRLDYDEMIRKLEARGLEEDEAKAARNAIKQEFRRKQTHLGQAITQKILERRASQNFQSSGNSPFKTNVKINAVGSVMKYGGRVTASAGVVFEVYNVAATPEGERADEALDAGGRISGGLMGAGIGGAYGARFGPWTAAGGTVGGGIVGSVLGEGAVRVICEEAKTPPYEPSDHFYGHPGGARL